MARFYCESPANRRRRSGSRTAVCGLIVLSFWAPAFGQADPNAEWMTAARKQGLSESSIRQLNADGILVTGRTYKQVFQAYMGATLPVFVTSDSLLNAYHVLYEESVLRLEQANARKLPGILRFVLANLDSASQDFRADPNLAESAKARATIVVGTALRLLDDTFQVSDPPIMAIIQDETTRIVAAQGTRMPAWMGQPQGDLLTIDYSRYKVRGFYTKTETLTRYFRAVAWLQSIPFRVNRDDELVSILMLGGCITKDRFAGDQAKCADYQGFFNVYKEFIGCGDDWDLITAAGEVERDRALDLGAVRKRLIAEAQTEGGPQINDQIGFAPDDPNAVTEPNFRILSAYRIPDGVLFQRTTDNRKFERQFPTGLEVCVALGSAFAPGRINEPEKARVLETIEKCRSLFRGSSLHFDYLNMVASLLERPEPNSPPFMTRAAWQTKSCATVLAGWAQLRHTWILQAKLTEFYSARFGGERPSAFVEPVPQFYDRMANLASRTRRILRAAGAMGSDYTYAASMLSKAADALEKSQNLRDAGELMRAGGYGEEDVFMPWWQVVERLEGDNRAKAGQIRQIVSDLNAGKVDRSLSWIDGTSNFAVEPHWSSLEETSRRLKSIARKQLAHVVPDANDERFLNEEYGQRLAGIMLYGGNSYMSPRDDACRIADVFSNAFMPAGIRYLLAGIGRPRAIYVLYPWADTEVLCMGAVLPYYEFVSSSRLTDDEWKTMLDSDKPPAVPKWLAPITTNDGRPTSAAATSR